MPQISIACSHCKKINQITDLTKDQIKQLYDPNRQHIQNILPNHRELFITGMCNDCWNDMFEEKP